MIKKYRAWTERRHARAERRRALDLLRHYHGENVLQPGDGPYYKWEPRVCFIPDCGWRRYE